MSESPELFYESFQEGLRDDVNAIGGAKAVGAMLWPEKDPLAARNKVNDCLNIEKRDRFSEEQEDLIIKLAREKRGFSAGLYARCDATGFERPKPKDPEDEHAKRQREFIAAVKTIERIAPQVSTLLVQSTNLRSIKS